VLIEPAKQLADASRCQSDARIRGAVVEVDRVAVGSWIAGNAGIEGAIVVQKVKEGRGAFGFNAATEAYEDLVEAGVIDPTKVVRAALQNAASVASLLITTEALIAEKPEKKAGAGAMPDMGDMGM
jgi:chaperonin GroEL